LSRIFSYFFQLRFGRAAGAEVSTWLCQPAQAAPANQFFKPGVRILLGFLIAGVLSGQTGSPEVKDSLGRTTPQESVFQFLQTCHAREYTKAALYLDLRKMPAAQRAKDGPVLAQQLEDLLDDTPFEITTLSNEPEGDDSDGVSPEVEPLATFQLAGQNLDLRLERVQLRPGLHVWLVSADSVALIPKAHQTLAETAFEKKLPQPLVTFEVLETPVWRWIALAGMAAVAWIIGGALSWIVLRAMRRVIDAPALHGPVRMALALAGFRGALGLAPPATIARIYIERGFAMAFSLVLAWIVAVLIDVAADRWRRHLDPRMQAVRYSVLPLGRQVLKLSVFLIAILSVLSVWGYDTTTIVAGLGVGGLAVALAAQKTIENLFGGISVIGDRPVLVGDVCRFGDRVGEIMHIGLRSTRIRTPDRTVISVPNAQFSSIQLENISRRDKIWFHPTLSLRRDTTSDQLLEVLSSIGEILTDQCKVETGKIPVRFIGVGAYSLDIEADAYVITADYDEFLSIRQELLIQMLKAVEQAGTALAVPIQESFAGGKVHST
jgi:MscS family membrane protein